MDKPNKPAPDPRETHEQLVERIRKGQPPARPMVIRVRVPDPKGGPDDEACS